MNIVNTMLWMKKNAYEETTIRKVAKLLRHLQRNCNTKDPETAKLYIAKKTTSNGHKENLVEAYAIHLRSQNLTWEQPFYQRYDKKRRPPKEELIDFLINHARLEMALKLSMTKDLGERPIELTWLTLKDIDLVTGIVSITGAKHTVGREGKLRPRTLDLLRIYTKKKRLNPNSRLFNMNSDSLSNNYRHARNRIAEDYDMLNSTKTLRSFFQTCLNPASLANSPALLVTDWTGWFIATIVDFLNEDFPFVIMTIQRNFIV